MSLEEESYALEALAELRLSNMGVSIPTRRDTDSIHPETLTVFPIIRR